MAADAPGLRSPRLWAYAGTALATQVALVAMGAALPLLLEHRTGATPFVIGWVLAVMPIFGLAVQPVINALSDRAVTPWGRRKPFLAAGATLGGLGLVVLPAASSLAAAVAATALFALGFVCADGPYRASMSEALPGQETLASAVQAVVKGVGTLVAFGAVALAGEQAFVAVGGLWAAAIALTIAVVPTRAVARVSTADAREPVRIQPGLVVGLLLAWIGMYAVTSFAVSYMVHDLAGVVDVGTAAGQAASRQASLMLGMFALTAIAAAVPAARLAERWGASVTLAGGMALLAAGYLGAALASQPIHAAAFSLLAGAGFAALQVLPYPLLLASAEPGREGRIASLYTVTIDVAQVVAVVACGWLVSMAHSYRVVFVVALAATLVAAWLFAQRRQPAPSASPALSVPQET